MFISSVKHLNFATRISLIFPDNLECVWHQLTQHSKYIECLMKHSPLNYVPAGPNVNPIVLSPVCNDRLCYYDASHYYHSVNLLLLLVPWVVTTVILEY